MKFTKQKLGEFLRVTRGASLPGTGYADEGKYLRLTLANFHEEGGFKEFKSTQGKYFVGTFDKRFIMHKGDLITPLTEQSPGLLGSVAIIPCDNLYIQSQDVGLITCNAEKLDERFAYYMFLTNSVREQISARSQQTKIRHTSPDKIADVEVYLPDLPTQLRIAGVLGSLDEKIELNRKKIAELEALAKTIYDYWFVQFEFPDKNGKPYRSSGGKMVWNEQLKMEIPAGWGAKTLAEFADIYNGATPSTSDQDNYSGDIIWVTPKDLSDQKSKFTFASERSISFKGYNSCSTRLLPVGTILMSSRAPIGLLSIARVELCTNQGFKSIVPKNGDDLLYLYYYLKSHMHQIEMLGSGTTFKEVSRNSVSKFMVAYASDCPFYKKWVTLLKPIFDVQAEATQAIAKLKTLRDDLLPLLMNGQVKVAG